MSERQGVLLVSANSQTLDSIGFCLRPEGFKVTYAQNATEVDYYLSGFEAFNAAIVDLASLGEIDLSVIEFISVRSKGCPIIALVRQADLLNAIEALKKGAYDYILEPTEPEEIVLALRRLTKANLRQNILRARQHGWSREEGLSGIIDNSLLMRERLQRLGLLARTEAALILVGDDGVGKEYLARAVHFLSFRRFQPFVRVRCRNKSADELLFELFGSCKSNAPDLPRESFGAIARADGGSLFLDEVAAMPEKVQQRIIDFLGESERSSGFGDDVLMPNIRLISATEESLEQIQKSGMHSKEFWNRVCGGIINVPNLQERIEELPEMARSFVQYFAQENSKTIEGISEEAIEALMEHSWPGNIRELRNIIERAVVKARDTEIKLEDLLVFKVDSLRSKTSIHLDLKSVHLNDVEEFIISKVLRQSRGNVSRSADALGISRGTLYNKMKKYGLENLVKRFIEIS
jgi:DNA-binding NtrC family response regulator